LVLEDGGVTTRRSLQLPDFSRQSYECCFSQAYIYVSVISTLQTSLQNVHSYLVSRKILVKGWHSASNSLLNTNVLPQP